jgi:predicted nucleic acid-binding protein
MADYYFDSSAVVKKYVVESGTPWVLKLLKPSSANTVYVSQLTAVEVISAFSRRLRAGQTSSVATQKFTFRFKRDLKTRLRIMMLTDSMVSDAMNLSQDYGLRAYDAVQLATAMELNFRLIAKRLPNPVFVSADIRLDRVAQFLGFTVEDPNAHP